MTIAASAHGGIFLGLIDGRLGGLRNGKLDVFTIWRSNPDHERIGSLTPNPDGSAWGNSTGGLVAWKDGQSKVLDERNGLPCRRVNASLVTKNGDLWLSQPCGFTRIPRDQLEASWKSDVPQFKVETLDVLDGAQTGRSVLRHLPLSRPTANCGSQMKAYCR